MLDASKERAGAGEVRGEISKEEGVGGSVDIGGHFFLLFLFFLHLLF
jgi:hypothetical protein